MPSCGRCCEKGSVYKASSSIDIRHGGGGSYVRGPKERVDCGGVTAIFRSSHSQVFDQLLNL